MSEVVLRAGVAADAPAMAEVLIEARRHMTYLPLVHTDNEAAPFLGRVLASALVQVAERQGVVVAFAAVEDGWLAHLYVRPDAQKVGIGTRLIAWAQETSPTGLDLWVFARNTGARALYAAHGWREVGGTDGDNEEGQPDVRMRWAPAAGD